MEPHAVAALACPTLRPLTIVRGALNNKYTGLVFVVLVLVLVVPGGGFLVLVAVVACHYFYYPKTTPGDQ